MYAVVQDYVLSAFLQWHLGAVGIVVQIMLLRPVSSYVPQMWMPLSTWGDLSFALNGNVTRGAVRCANCLTVSLHHIDAALYILTPESIYTALSSDPNLYIIGPFTAEYDGVGFVCVHKTIYLPAPYMGMFLERNLSPT